MNSRQYKKYANKYYYKKFYSVRRHIILNVINKNISSEEYKYCNNIIVITDSKSMNLKHPINEKVLYNCYPISMK